MILVTPDPQSGNASATIETLGLVIATQQSSF